jgi:anti-anti-sigma factor
MIAPASCAILCHTPGVNQANLATRVTGREGCVLIAVDGELDLGTADELQETLEAAIIGETGSVVLDLTKLRFCDSAGLAVLVKTHNRLSDGGRRLILAGPTPPVARVLELSGLNQIITTATDADDACAIASRP